MNEVKNNIDISGLLDKFAFQMTGRELCNLIQASITSVINLSESSAELCTGIHDLANRLQCCESTIYMLKREGVLNEAIKTRIGKKIVFDVEKARIAAEKYQEERRGIHE